MIQLTTPDADITTKADFGININQLVTDTSYPVDKFMRPTETTDSPRDKLITLGKMLSKMPLGFDIIPPELERGLTKRQRHR